MKISRRKLGLTLVSAAALAQDRPPQQETDDDLRIQREQLKANFDQIDKVKLTRETEPAFHFKA